MVTRQVTGSLHPLRDARGRTHHATQPGRCAYGDHLDKPGSAQHTVTRVRKGGVQVAGRDSPTLRTGENYSYTYNAVGIFEYHCSIHQTLTGSVTMIAP